MIYKKIQLLAKQTIIYAINHIVIHGCSYIVLLLQINRLTSREYGTVTEFYGNYIALLGVIYTLAMDLAYFKFVHQIGKEASLNAITTILCMTNILFSILVIAFVPKIAAITHYQSHRHYFYYMIVIVILDTFLLIPYARLRSAQQLSRFTCIKILQGLSSILFSFMLLYLPACLRFLENVTCMVFKIPLQLDGLDAIFIANICTNMVTLMLLSPYFQGLQLKWDAQKIGMIGKYALPIFFSTLFFRVNDILPRLLFRSLVPDNFYRTHSKEEMLGNLGVSYKLTLIVAIAIKSFQHATEPFFFSQEKSKDASKLYSQTMYFFTLVSSMGLLLISLNIDWITHIFIRNREYHHTIRTVPYLTAIHVILGVYYNSSMAFKLSNKPIYNSLMSGGSSLIIWMLSVLLLPRFGHWGCVYASLIGVTLMTVCGYFLAQRCYPIRYSKYGFFVLIGSCFLINQVHIWPQKLTFLPELWSYIVLNLLIIVSFLGIGIIGHKMQ